MLPTARLWRERCVIIPMDPSYIGLPVKFSCICDVAEDSQCSNSGLTKKKPTPLDSEQINLIKRTLFQCDTVAAGTYFPAHYWNSIIWIGEVQMSWKEKQIFSIALHFSLQRYNGWLWSMTDRSLPQSVIYLQLSSQSTYSAEAHVMGYPQPATQHHTAFCFFPVPKRGRGNKIGSIKVSKLTGWDKKNLLTEINNLQAVVPGQPPP